jgi:predicted enzyme related to lactoylglutathione lyase
MILEANVTIMVSSMDRALAFYEKILGLDLKGKYGSKYAEVQVNGFIIGLHLRNYESSASLSNNLFVGFMVENLENSVANLKSKGVEFSTEIEEGVAGKFAYFADPDGNPLYLWQRKSRK